MVANTNMPPDDTPESFDRHGARAYWVYVFIMLMRLAGMRVGEALNLDQQSFAWQKGTMTITSRKTMTTRVVAINPELAQLLTTYLTACRQGRVVSRTKDLYLFGQADRKRLRRWRCRK